MNHFFGFDQANIFSVFGNLSDFWHAFLIFLASYLGNKHANNGK